MTDTPMLTKTRWEIRPRDGGPPIRGDLRTLQGHTPTTAVVVCHGFKGFREWGFFPFLARALAGRGHAVVTFDFSRNGVGPDGVDFSALDLFAENTHSRNVAEIRAVLAAVTDSHLLDEAPDGIGLLGHSRGGGEAVLAASEAGEVDALVTWAAISNVDRWSEEQKEAWQRGETVTIPNARTGQEMPMGPGYWADVERHREELDVIAAASALTIPWLVVHGTADESVDPGDARALFEAGHHDANRELLLIEGAGHTFGAVHPFDGAPDALREATSATLDWFDEHLAAD
jgi:uncharacterized protein